MYRAVRLDEIVVDPEVHKTGDPSANVAAVSSLRGSAASQPSRP
jgi:hypothetical protein